MILGLPSRPRDARRIGEQCAARTDIAERRGIQRAEVPARDFHDGRADLDLGEAPDVPIMLGAVGPKMLALTREGVFARGREQNEGK